MCSVVSYLFFLFSRCFRSSFLPFLFSISFVDVKVCLFRYSFRSFRRSLTSTYHSAMGSSTPLTNACWTWPAYPLCVCSCASLKAMAGLNPLWLARNRWHESSPTNLAASVVLASCLYVTSVTKTKTKNENRKAKSEK